MSSRRRGNSNPPPSAGNSNKAGGGARPSRIRLALRFLPACLSLSALGAGFFRALPGRPGVS